MIFLVSSLLNSLKSTVLIFSLPDFNSFSLIIPRQFSVETLDKEILMVYNVLAVESRYVIMTSGRLPR